MPLLGERRHPGRNGEGLRGGDGEDLRTGAGGELRGVTPMAGRHATCTSPRISAVVAAGGRRIGDVHHISAGLLRDRFHAELRQRADADRAVAEALRIGFGLGEEFRDRIDAEAGRAPRARSGAASPGGVIGGDVGVGIGRASSGRTAAC